MTPDVSVGTQTAASSATSYRSALCSDNGTAATSSCETVVRYRGGSSDSESTAQDVFEDCSEYFDPTTSDVPSAQQSSFPATESHATVRSSDLKNPIEPDSMDIDCRGLEGGSSRFTGSLSQACTNAQYGGDDTTAKPHSAVTHSTNRTDTGDPETGQGQAGTPSSSRWRLRSLSHQGTGPQTLGSQASTYCPPHQQSPTTTNCSNQPSVGQPSTSGFESGPSLSSVQSSANRALREYRRLDPVSRPPCGYVQPFNSYDPSFMYRGPSGPQRTVPATGASQISSFGLPPTSYTSTAVPSTIQPPTASTAFTGFAPQPLVLPGSIPLYQYPPTGPFMTGLPSSSTYGSQPTGPSVQHQTFTATGASQISSVGHPPTSYMLTADPLTFQPPTCAHQSLVVPGSGPFYHYPPTGTAMTGPPASSPGSQPRWSQRSIGDPYNTSCAGSHGPSGNHPSCLTINNWGNGDQFFRF